MSMGFSGSSKKKKTADVPVVNLCELCGKGVPSSLSGSSTERMRRDVNISTLFVSSRYDGACALIIFPSESKFRYINHLKQRCIGCHGPKMKKAPTSSLLTPTQKFYPEDKVPSSNPAVASNSHG